MSPGNPLPPSDGAQRTARNLVLRRAPEQREMAVIAGLAFFLNLFAGSILQYVHFRWGLLISQMLFIAGPVLLAIRWFYLDRSAVLPFVAVPSRFLLATVLGTLGLNHLLTLAMLWQESIFPQPRILRALLENFLDYQNAFDLALILLLAAGIVPVCEEILFRGFLQSGLIRMLESGPKGIIASAVLFAAFHLDPWRFLATLVLGLFLGFLTHRSGSLVPAVTAHALNNLMAIMLTDRGTGDPLIPGSIATVGLAIVLSIVSTLLLHRKSTVET
jgi:membrane protease YdiL (CAAX protease family)